MLGGPVARADAIGCEKLRVARISSPKRPDLLKQTTAALKVIELTATQRTAPADDEVSDKLVLPSTDWEAALGARGTAGAHAALWKECVATNLPMLILEDGLHVAPKLGQVTAHLLAVISRVRDVGNQPVVLYLGCEASSLEFQEQWLPTDLLVATTREPVVLREPATKVVGAFAYCLWPSTARRLLGALPIASSVDAFIAREVSKDAMRALVAHPQLVARDTAEYVPRTRWSVCYKPRVAIRASPEPNGFVEGARSHGEVLEAIGRSADGNWLQLGPRAWVMVHHEDHGTLLEPLDPPEEEFGEA